MSGAAVQRIYIAKDIQKSLILTVQVHCDSTWRGEGGGMGSSLSKSLFWHLRSRYETTGYSSALREGGLTAHRSAYFPLSLLQGAFTVRRVYVLLYCISGREAYLTSLCLS
jgi:hypothetical protein